MEEPGSPGTTIQIFGYNHNDGSKLGHDQLRDYILSFTKFGSIEPQLWFSNPKYASTKARLADLELELRGLGFDGSRHRGRSDAKSELVPFRPSIPRRVFRWEIPSRKGENEGKRARPITTAGAS